MAQDAGLRTALWLQPKPGSPLHTVLKRTITGLAPVFEDAPVFDPHVTLATGILVATQQEVDFVLDSMQAAARAVPHLTVRFSELGYGSQFFRKVVFEVERTAALVSMAAIAHEEYAAYPALRRALVHDQRKKHSRYVPSPADIASLHAQAALQRDAFLRDFRPHLSLVYSDTFPVSEALRHTVNQRLEDVFGPNFASRGLGWTGGQLALVNCEGPVEQWTVLGTRDI